MQFSTQGAAALVTPRAVLKRAITTEVSTGLTCIGDAVSTASGYSSATTESSGATEAGATSTYILTILMSGRDADILHSYNVFVTCWGRGDDAGADSSGWCCSGFLCLWPDVELSEYIGWITVGVS